jgi:hypothetical protein
MNPSRPEPGQPDFPPGAFARVDEGDDLIFYAPPRLVTHIDESAITALTECYRGLLPSGGKVLDLMSSWVSHLPPELELAECVGHGMNIKELAANGRLTWRFIQDLNRHTALPLEDAGFDAALCCASVQYLQQPVEVFAEARRVLRPGAPFIVSFSNRCFPTKAVAIWRALNISQHASLVSLYAERAGFASVEAKLLAHGGDGDPLVVVIARA